ncbi:MAG: hypothetical protein Q8M88_15575 [Phenylobacterium sp.]|uniref:hypothetical protein n=1 Tax=Phenylobacterium sp. TaxID=1871053 RepID=UPI0027357F49|nr:hypothetical protein [Phenylobacterium sp.]MDP3175848.1 hypothetical protein [Phenylobacterium sp.]
MRVLRRFVAFSTLALLAACETVGAPPPPPPMAPPSATVFRSSDFSWSAVPGRNAVVGRLTYKRPEARYTCAGAAVVLTPETLWTRRRMNILYNSPISAALPVEEVRARTPASNGEDFSAFVRRTTCDAADRFSFSGLPDGAWYVISVAKPAEGRGPSIAVMRRVETRGGRPTSVGL